MSSGVEGGEVADEGGVGFAADVAFEAAHDLFGARACLVRFST
jgi:hypothetical protein